MFKENKTFWLYIAGCIVIFFLLFFGIRSYFSTSDINIFNLSNEISTPTVKPTAITLEAEDIQYEQAPDNQIDVSKDYFAVVETNLGEFELDLFEGAAANTVNNFIFLATDDYYNGTHFHRLVPNVLLQGGSRNTLNNDPSDDATGGPGYTIKDEINWDKLGLTEKQRTALVEEGYISRPGLDSRKMAKYKVAMANAGPDLNGSQFFIILAEAGDTALGDLEGRHTVFGEITSNFELIDGFNNIEVENINSNSPRPTQQIIINDIGIFIR